MLFEDEDSFDPLMEFCDNEPRTPPPEAEPTHFQEIIVPEAIVSPSRGPPKPVEVPLAETLAAPELFESPLAERMAELDLLAGAYVLPTILDEPDEGSNGPQVEEPPAPEPEERDDLFMGICLEGVMPPTDGLDFTFDGDLNNMVAPILEEPVLAEDRHPLVEPEQLENLKESLVGLAKNQAEAVLLAVALTGISIPRQIVKTMVKYNIHLSETRKKTTDVLGTIANVMWADRCFRSNPANRRNEKRIPKLESARWFDEEAGDKRANVPRKIFLRPAGRVRARQLLGLAQVEAVSNDDLSIFTAFDKILSEKVILTWEEIIREFEAGKYCSSSGCWKPPANGERLGPLIRSCLAGILGNYINNRINSDAGKRNTISTYARYYWFSSWGLQPLLEKLNHEKNPHFEEGMRCYEPLIAHRIGERRRHNVCNDRLELGRRILGAYDIGLDTMNFCVAADSVWNFFEVSESVIPGAGGGLRAKLDLPAGTIVFIPLEHMREKDPNDASWAAYTFSAQHPETHVVYEIETRVNGEITCCAAYMNDSRDGQQHFDTECHSYVDSAGAGHFDVFLKSRRQIFAGEEVFYNYGEDYWRAAEANGVVGTQAPQQLRSDKKRPGSEFGGEQLTKRAKFFSPLSPLPLPLFLALE